MSEHHLPRVAPRIFEQPHLISPAGARAVLTAVGPRLGIGYLIDASDNVVRLETAVPSLPESRLHNALAPDREWDTSRLFALDKESGIAWIQIEGELVHRFGHLEPYSGMTGYDAIILKVIAAAADGEVRGIFLDIDSPGGEVYGVEAAAKAIMDARQIKPVWAMVNEHATSAAYWLASAAHNVFVPSLGDVGSIGAVIIHEDISDALDAAGVKITVIHAPEGGHKADNSPFSRLSDPALANLQSRADAAYVKFASAVADGRGIPVAAVHSTQARILMAPEALAADLVDDVAPAADVFEDFTVRLARPESVALLPTG